MAQPPLFATASRRAQMFPVLEPGDIDRMARFGETVSYPARERIVTAGALSPGLIVLHSGRIAVTYSGEGAPNNGVSDESAIIVTHEARQFMGELAQLSDRPSLVNADTLEPVEGFVIRADRLRDLIVQEAELGERIMRALILRRVGLLESGRSGPIIIGRADHPDVIRLQGFLSRNGQPYHALDSDSDSCAKTLIGRFHIDPDHLPIVLCANGKLLRNPSENELARCIGLVRPIDTDKLYDVAIVGAGPAGLAAAVYAASEGLSVIVLDCRAFGGQAGASARIENYLGFPTGIGGLALMARAHNQAQKFGVEMAIPDQAHRLEMRSDQEFSRYFLDLGNGEKVQSRAVVLATGVRYRRPDVANLAAFEGSSVHYWASPIELRLCDGHEVALVGAGNSAGQAAVYLASRVKKVTLLARGASLRSSMSHYLVERILAQPNIEVLTRSEITSLQGGGGNLESVCWRDETGETTQVIRHLFLFIGAEPNTDWLAECDVALDEKGFIRTGAGTGAASHPLETSLPGVFAIGDVRSGSVKRVAAAVGEGAQVVAALHIHLAAGSFSPIAPSTAEKN
ncbi:MAG TPA: FAD-dependent oxidoreductase [Dongiaceae bacterium]